MSRAVLVPADFNPVPSVSPGRAVRLEISETAGTDDVLGPDGPGALGIPVQRTGEPPSRLGFDRAALTRGGFDAKPGQTLVLPPEPGGGLHVAVGIGDDKSGDAAAARDAAAAFALATAWEAEVGYVLDPAAGLDPGRAAQMAVEGIVLARYSYDSLKRKPAATPLRSVTLVTGPGQRDAVAAGAERGLTMARATMLARDLANTPPAHLTAERMARVAAILAAHAGLSAETFDRHDLVRLGCGGLIGVNGGSADEPRMVKLTYRPHVGAPSGHLALVAKGIMYDSGGIGRKPADPVHATMKNDMTGAAAVLAAMLALGDLGCRTMVTGYLMCTDNLPSGTALKLGDVITIHGGTTVEVLNTDAEGRLVMADALVLAAEEKPDAIVDIATLTGACLRALGTRLAGVIGNSQPLVDQVLRSGAATQEQAWQLPLEQAYRGELDSDVADLANMGGPNAGAITAALFLEEFTGGLPWAHLDIAGVAQVDRPESWRTSGCSGFGARLLADLAVGFSPPLSGQPAFIRSAGVRQGAGEALS
jgi:leucyl aminopeptidase